MKSKPTTDAQKLANRNRELAILNEITSALNEEVDLSAALKTALEKVADLMELNTGWIWLLREEGKHESYLAAAQNLPPALRENPRKMEGGCYCLDTFRTGDLEGAANVNVVTCSRLTNLVDGTGGLRYHTSVPLFAAHGTKLGVLNVADTEWRELSQSELQLLYTIGDLLSITIERARHFARSTQIGAAEERNRLAREIHDTLAQNLAAITLQMETADALLESGAEPGQIWPYVRKGLELSRGGLLEARRSVLDLRAAPLEGRSLGEAIAELLQKTEEQAGVIVTCEMVGIRQPLQVRIEVAIYRIIQEALANIQRHAQATHVLVELIVSARLLKLSIRDDGLGFRPEIIPDGRYGIIGINERVHLLGGKLDIQSDPSAGTHLRISIPLQNES